MGRGRHARGRNTLRCKGDHNSAFVIGSWRGGDRECTRVHVLSPMQAPVVWGRCLVSNLRTDEYAWERQHLRMEESYRTAAPPYTRLPFRCVTVGQRPAASAWECGCTARYGTGVPWTNPPPPPVPHKPPLHTRSRESGSFRSRGMGPLSLLPTSHSSCNSREGGYGSAAHCPALVLRALL